MTLSEEPTWQPMRGRSSADDLWADDACFRTDAVPKVWHGDSGYAGHTYTKKRKARAERRKAKVQPDCLPTYGKYKGYLS